MTNFEARRAPEAESAGRAREGADNDAPERAPGEAPLRRRRLPIQTRLEVGAVDDPAEREADAVARRAVAFLAGGGAAPGVPGSSGGVNRRIHRRATADTVVGPEGGAVDRSTEAAIASARGGGAPLADPVRRSMESAIGADFSDVRVHDGPSADAAASSMGALAFTTGSDVFFAKGQYDPGSSSGQETLAHELTHVVQQTGGAQRKVGSERAPEQPGPAPAGAQAYAQGNDIHLGAGQEQHLPHEAWHVVQQAQGRVRPTMQMAGGVPVNDDAGLEREADVMGGRAVQMKADPDAVTNRKIRRKGGNWGKLAAAVKDGQTADLVEDTGAGGAVADFEEEEDEDDDDEEEEAEKEEAEGEKAADDAAKEGAADAEKAGEDAKEPKKSPVKLDLDKKRASVDPSKLGVEGFKKIAISPEGAEIGLEPFEGASLDIRVGPKGGKLAQSFTLLEGVKVPPKGLDVPLLNVKIPLGPGFGIDVVAKVEGGFEFGGIKGGYELVSNSTDVEERSRIKLTGTGESKAKAGVSLEVAMWGGVPIVAAVRAGLRAKAEAAAKLGFELGGMVDVRSTIPAEHEASKETSRTGELYLNVAGDGSLIAALSAFLGYELFSFQGDLYELVFAEAPLASLNTGARLGTRYSGAAASREFFAEPLDKKEGWVNFDWLMGKWWKARKLDAAKEAATATKADVAALKDVKDRPDIAGFLAKVQAGEEQLAVANGALQLLLNEEATLQQVIESDTASIASLQTEIDTTLAKKNAEEKSKRWAITNFFRGDIPELKDARAKATSMQKQLQANQAKLAGLAPRKIAARQQFLATLNPARIDAMAAEAQAKADATYKENWKLFSKEFDAQRKATLVDRDELSEQLASQDAILTDLAARIARAEVGNWDTGALESQLGKAKAQRALIEAKLRKLNRGADAGAQDMLKLLTGSGITAPKAKGGANADKFAALAGQLKK